MLLVSNLIPPDATWASIISVQVTTFIYFTFEDFLSIFETTSAAYPILRAIFHFIFFIFLLTRRLSLYSRQFIACNGGATPVVQL
jgi:hypothetical protein